MVIKIMSMDLGVEINELCKGNGYLKSTSC